MKFIATFLSIAAASKGDFPAFDSFHCNCQIETQVKGNCKDVY